MSSNIGLILRPANHRLNTGTSPLPNRPMPYRNGTVTQRGLMSLGTITSAAMPRESVRAGSGLVMSPAP